VADGWGATWAGRADPAIVAHGTDDSRRALPPAPRHPHPVDAPAGVSPLPDRGTTWPTPRGVP